MSTIPAHTVQRFLARIGELDEEFNAFAEKHLAGCSADERRRAKLAYGAGMTFMLNAAIELFREGMQNPPEDAAQPAKRPH